MESAKATVSGLKGQPEKLQLLHLDKTQLGWLERKEIRCEFLVEITPATLMPGAGRSEVVFVVYFLWF